MGKLLLLFNGCSVKTNFELMVIFLNIPFNFYFRIFNIGTRSLKKSKKKQTQNFNIKMNQNKKKKNCNKKLNNDKDLISFSEKSVNQKKRNFNSKFYYRVRLRFYFFILCTILALWAIADLYLYYIK